MVLYGSQTAKGVRDEVESSGQMVDLKVVLREVYKGVDQPLVGSVG